MSQPFDYTNDEYHQSRHSEIIDNSVLYSAWSYYAWTRYISPSSPKSVLEVGGAFGWNLAYAKEVGLQCDLIEPSKSGRAASTKLGIECYESVADVPDSTYDLILLRHVLEHVQNPALMLEDLTRLMSSTSKLTVVLPVEKATQMPDPNDINHHLYCWNPQAIQNLLQASGYTVEQISFNYMTGRRLLLPLWRAGRRKLYTALLGLVGRAFNAKELVISARRQIDN